MHHWTVGHKAITWTNDDFSFIGPLGIYFCKIWIEVQNILWENYKKMQWLFYMVFYMNLQNFNIWIMYFIDKDKNDI